MNPFVFANNKTHHTMNAIDILLDKGSVQLSGLVKDKIADAIYKLVCKRNNEILGALVFETRKADGFHSDSTSVYIVNRNASFRPSCKESFNHNLAICSSKEDYSLFRSLKKLGVCPMLESEYQELKKLGLAA